MKKPFLVPNRNSFFLRHIVALGAAVGGFTGICLLLYIAAVIASGDIGSPIMPLLIPVGAVIFSFIYTLAVVVPSCILGEALFAQVLHLPWYLRLLATSVIFAAILFASVVLYERYHPTPTTNIPMAAQWIGFAIPFMIYWPFSRFTRP